MASKVKNKGEIVLQFFSSKADMQAFAESQEKYVPKRDQTKP